MLNEERQSREEICLEVCISITEDDEALKVCTSSAQTRAAPTGVDPVPHFLGPQLSGHCSKYCSLQLVKDNARAMTGLTPINPPSQSTDRAGLSQSLIFNQVVWVGTMGGRKRLKSTCQY